MTVSTALAMVIVGATAFAQGDASQDQYTNEPTQSDPSTAPATDASRPDSTASSPQMRLQKSSTPDSYSIIFPRCVPEVLNTIGHHNIIFPRCVPEIPVPIQHHRTLRHRLPPTPHRIVLGNRSRPEHTQAVHLVVLGGGGHPAAVRGCTRHVESCLQVNATTPSWASSTPVLEKADHRILLNQANQSPLLGLTHHNHRPRPDQATGGLPVLISMLRDFKKTVRETAPPRANQAEPKRWKVVGKEYKTGGPVWIGNRDICLHIRRGDRGTRSQKGRGVVAEGALE